MLAKEILGDSNRFSFGDEKEDLKNLLVVAKALKPIGLFPSYVKKFLDTEVIEIDAKKYSPVYDDEKIERIEGYLRSLDA